MANYTKIFAQVDAPFWSDEKYILRAGPPRGRYVVWQPIPHSNVVMITATGEEGRRVEALSNEDVLGEVHEALSEMYEEVPTVRAVHVCRWSSDPHFCGSYSFLPTG